MIPFLGFVLDRVVEHVNSGQYTSYFVSLSKRDPHTTRVDRENIYAAPPDTNSC